MCELEEATETVDEVKTPIASTNVDEALFDKLLHLTSPKVSASTTGAKSMKMKQMMFFEENGS